VLMPTSPLTLRLLTPEINAKLPPDPCKVEPANKDTEPPMADGLELFSIDDPAVKASFPEDKPPVKPDPTAMKPDEPLTDVPEISDTSPETPS